MKAFFGTSDPGPTEPTTGTRRSIEGLRAAVAPRPVRPIRTPIPGWQRLVLVVAPVGLLLLAWWLLTLGPIEERAVTYQILPAPGEVLSSLKVLWYDAGLMRSIVQSLYRVFVGFAIAGVLAFVLGVLMGAFTHVRAALAPFSLLGGYLPLPALVPLTLAWWGIGEKQKVGFLAIASFVYLWPLVLKSLDAVDDVYLRTAYTLGASRLQVIRKVFVPVAAADIYHALRLAFGVGWAYVILAEMIAAERGVGYLIYMAQRRSHPDRVYMLLIVIVLLAVLVDKLLAAGERLLFPYRHAR
jgi:NitT/TauT family transport system permease protein